MKHAPCHKEPKPNFTAVQVADWIALQRKERWSMNKLAKHLGMGFLTVQTYIEKYELGQLP